MVVESFACPACGEQLAPGRLSCPQCGTVLAAVARSWRSAAGQADVPPAMPPSSAPSWLDAATGPARPGTPAQRWPAGGGDWDDDAPLAAAAEPTAPPPAAADDDAEPIADGSHAEPIADVRDAEPIADVRDAEPAPIPTPVAALLDRAPGAWAAAAEPDAVEPPAEDSGQAGDAGGVDATDGDAPDSRFAFPTAPAERTPDQPVDESERAAVPTADARDHLAEDRPLADDRPPAAEPAWLTPSPAEPAAPASRLRPAGRANPFLDMEPPAPAPGAVPERDREPDAPAAPTPAAYVPPATSAAPAGSAAPAHVAATVPADAPARILPRAWDPAAAAAERSATTSPAPSARLAEIRTRLSLPTIDRARVDEVAGVIVLAGAMGSSIGFLLPWSRVVIGSRGAGSYFDTWGLAGQGHLVVFLLALGALALAAVPNRVDTWLRSGVVGIALGGLLLGLAWPYAFGPLGAAVGVVLLVVSACLLLVGGLLSTLVQRHGVPPPGV